MDESEIEKKVLLRTAWHGWKELQRKTQVSQLQ